VTPSPVACGGQHPSHTWSTRVRTDPAARLHAPATAHATSPTSAPLSALARARPPLRCGPPPRPTLRSGVRSAAAAESPATALQGPPADRSCEPSVGTWRCAALRLQTRSCMCACLTQTHYRLRRGGARVTGQDMARCIHAQSRRGAICQADPRKAGAPQQGSSTGAT